MKHILTVLFSCMALLVNAQRVMPIDGGKLVLRCADGARLRVLNMTADNEPVDTSSFKRLFGSDSVQVA